MKNQIKVIVIILLISLNNLRAQDAHFAQPLLSPLMFNPAMTGYMQGSKRLSLQHRAQWWEVAGRDAYQTTSLGYDMRFCSEYAFAGGIQVVLDQPYGNPMSNYQVQLSGAFHNQVSGLNGSSAGDGLFMAIGGQVGVLHYRLNEDRLRFEDQFDPVSSGFGGGQSQEIFAQDVISTLDLNVGLLLYSTEQSFNYTFGFSIHHINRPRVIFLDGQLLEEDQQALPMKVTGYGRVKIVASNYTQSMIELTSYYQQQGKQWQWLGGLTLGRDFNNSNLTAGAFYRIASHWESLTNFDALIAQLGYDTKHIRWNIAYEFNLSDLAAASNQVGGIELGLTYQFGQQQDCPRCPKHGGGAYNYYW